MQGPEAFTFILTPGKDVDWTIPGHSSTRDGDELNKLDSWARLIQ